MKRRKSFSSLWRIFVLVVTSASEKCMRVRVDESRSEHTTLAVDFHDIAGTAEATSQRLVPVHTDDAGTLHRHAHASAYAGIGHLSTATCTRRSRTGHRLCGIHQERDR